MARLPIETGSNTARNLSYFLFNLGDTRDKGLNALTNGLSGLGNTISDYYKTQRAFDEAAKERQRAENLQIQKMQQDEAYRQADLNLKKENLEFEKYKYNNPKRESNGNEAQKEKIFADFLAYQNTLPISDSNPNNSNLQQSPQMPTQTTQTEQTATPLKPTTLRNAQLSQFLKEKQAPQTQQIQTPIPNPTSQVSQNSQEPQNTNTRKSGIAAWIDYFNQKKFLTLADVNLAKEMGIDLAKEYRKEEELKADLNLKKVDVGKSIDKANDHIAALNSTARLLLDTKGQAGVWNGISRWAHNATGGLTKLSGPLSRYNSRDFSNTMALAQSDAEGKATNQDKQFAMQIYSTRLRSPEEQRNSLSGAMEGTLDKLESTLYDIIHKGEELPKGMYEMYLMYKDFDAYMRKVQSGGNFSWSRARNMINYIENSNYGQKYDYNEWAKIRGNVK